MIREFWSLHMPAKRDYTLPNGTEYYGIFPTGFEKKVKATFSEFADESIEGGIIVHLCSGLSTWGHKRFDINPDSNATDKQDAAHTGLIDECARCVILDPYYTVEDYERAMNQPYVSVYNFIHEGERLLRPGGAMLVLHTRPPRRPKDWTLEALVAISMGPDRQLRCMQIWRKPNW